jgi:hypothetical protein
LDEQPRGPGTFRFHATDHQELVEPDEEIIRHLGQVVLRTKTDPAFLERMGNAVGWPDASARLRRSTREAVRRGDFGEAIAAEALEEFGGFSIPVRKLRFQPDPEGTLHGTDVIAFRISTTGELEELHFVEVKLRTFRDLPRAVEAHDQLSTDRAKGYADSLMFVGERLWETDRAMFKAFEDYLLRRERPERGSYGIFLVWDTAAWDEDVLLRLDEVDPLLEPLEVRVMTARELKALVEAVYDTIGADVDDDGS